MFPGIKSSHQHDSSTPYLAKRILSPYVPNNYIIIIFIDDILLTFGLKDRPERLKNLILLEYLKLPGRKLTTGF